MLPTTTAHHRFARGERRRPGPCVPWWHGIRKLAPSADHIERFLLCETDLLDQDRADELGTDRVAVVEGEQEARAAFGLEADVEPLLVQLR